jgi:nitrile hydratase accessory protein
MTQISKQSAIGACCLDALDRAGLNRVLLEADGPTFSQPWQAQAFAMTLALHEKGVFTWDEWASVLGEKISTAQKNGDADRGDTYYHHWLEALEHIVATHRAATITELQTRKQAWHEAAARTPHGQSIAL